MKNVYMYTHTYATISIFMAPVKLTAVGGTSNRQGKGSYLYS